MPLSAAHARALARALSERKLPPASAPAAALSGRNAVGVLDGCASLFNIPDLGKDVIAPGAFAASLKARGTLGIRMLWQHDPAHPNKPIGSAGLYATSILASVRFMRTSRVSW